MNTEASERRRASYDCRRRTWLKAACATAAIGPLSVRAAPLAGGRPVSLVVSYPVGGGADLMARLIAPKIGESLGQTVVVENKPGASGTIAAQQVARAANDGSVLLVDASSFAVNPALFPKLPYDTASAFTPLAVLALFPNVLVCTPGFEAKDVADVLRLARAKPGALTYASSGNGSAQHLAGAYFEQVTGARLLHVPYRGGGPAMTDVMGGQVPLFFANVASAMPHIQSGRLRPLAVTAKQRSKALPEIPTMAEVGVPPEYEVLEWNPVLAPAGVSPEVKGDLVKAIRHAMDDPEVRKRIEAMGGERFDGDPAAFLKAQQTLWGGVVREHGITRD